MSRFARYVPILKYHRVGPFRGDHVPTVSAEAFERQLQLIRRFGYRVLTLAEVAAYLEQGRLPPRRSLALTFDDGCEEVATVAWPILKRYGFPATVFVTPGEIGLPGFMSWAQVQDVAADSFEIGSHTVHHTYLPLAAPERMREEIVASKRLLEERLERAVDWISYPIGGYTPEVQRVACEAGYRLACTTNRTAARNGVDRFALRRIKMTDRDAHPLLFLAKVCGYYDVFRTLKRPS
jgi:peptidoglycan/xylan/chitin deacetylase (PgdA/CDA1 family)